MDNLEKELEGLGKEPIVVPEVVLNKVNVAYDSIRNRKSKEKGIKNKRKYILVAIIVIVASLGISPDVRAALNKLIFNFNNPSLETAVNNGHYQALDGIEYEDEDIDIKLENVMIDSSKIAFDYNIDAKSLKRLNKDKDVEGFMCDFHLYDEAGNVLLGKDCPIDSYGMELENDKEGNIRIKLLCEATNADIPPISKLNVKFNELILSSSDTEIRDSELFNENLNWEFQIDIDSKMSNEKAIEYSYEANSSNIEIHQVKALPTGLHLKYSYLPEGYGDNVMIAASVKDNNGEIIRKDSTSIEKGEKGEMIVSGMYIGITSFENIDKFTLEIPNPDGKTVDKVEFTRNRPE